MAEYQGRKVTLNKPMRGDVKKFKVYVKNPKGNVVKVNFGHGGTTANEKEKIMIKNFKDIVILLITSGVLILLGIIIVGDYYVALQENRPVDESIITLMKMSVTGLIGVIGGYIGGSKT